MKGFDPQFKDLDDYIRVITARIWEGREVERIREWYSDDCAVITPGGTSSGVDVVIRGTLETLTQFPDRRLLCEDIVSAGDDVNGYLSSHRIAGPMTHTGPGIFGEPTARRLVVRTVADCVCKDNRIVHEWLVRDQGAIARQIGSTAGILGHPLRSLVAAARLSAAAGEPLQAGWIVMAGGATAVEALQPGQHVLLEMQGLGRVEFNTVG